MQINFVVRTVKTVVKVEPNIWIGAIQSLLEDIIESSKPPLLIQADETERHYLSNTPFRYPPLKYGFAGSGEQSSLYMRGVNNVIKSI